MPRHEKLAILARGCMRVSEGASVRMSTNAADVLIVGAGLAGLAAAAALSGAGASVNAARTQALRRWPRVLLQAPALDEVIDSQHVLLGCCTNLIDLLRQAGADQHIRWYDAITFLEPATA